MLRAMWERWKRVSRVIGEFNARLILGALYWVLVGPIAMARRMFADPLGAVHGEGDSYWRPRGPGPVSLDEARRQ